MFTLGLNQVSHMKVWNVIVHSYFLMRARVNVDALALLHNCCPEHSVCILSALTVIKSPAVPAVLKFLKLQSCSEIVLIPEILNCPEISVI